MRNLSNKSSDRGFIAIIAALVLSVLLTALALDGSTRTYLHSGSIIEHIHKYQSEVSAQSCIFAAFHEIEDDPTFSHAQSTQVTFQEGYTCMIDAITEKNDVLDVITSASDSSAYTVYSASATQSQAYAPITNVSWHELTSIPP